MSFEAIQITLLRNQNDSLKLALQQSQAHNAILIRHNKVLTELAANKTAYADDLRQALNAQRVGNPEIKATHKCTGCRYLGIKHGSGWHCQAFGFKLAGFVTHADHQWPQYISTNDGTIKCVSGFQKQGAEQERDALRIKAAQMEKEIRRQQELITRLEDELIN